MADHVDYKYEHIYSPAVVGAVPRDGDWTGVPFLQQAAKGGGAYS